MNSLFAPRAVMLPLAIAIAGFSSVAQAGEDSDTVAQLKQVAKENSVDYQRLLARIAPIAQKAYTNKLWANVEKSLLAAGLKPELIEEHPYFAEYRCPVVLNAVATKDGSSMDLYVELDVSSGRSQPTYEVPPDHVVSQTIVGLISTPRVGLESAVKEKWFGSGTIVQEALGTWPVADAQTAFPILETVDLSYELMVDAAPGDADAAYRLRLELIKAKDDSERKLRLQCTVLTGRAEDGRHGPIDNWLHREISPPGTAVKLADELRALVKQKPASYQRLLRDANRIIGAAVARRQWTAVEPELKGQGMKLINDGSGDFGTRQRYLVAEKAFVTPVGQGMDLFVEINTARERSKIGPTREIVTSARAILRAEPKLPYADVMASGVFGKDTAADKALHHEESKKAAVQYPLLDSVEIYYCLAGDHRSTVAAYGFEVRPEFRGRGNRSGWQKLFILVPSGLDPPEQTGGSVLEKDFMSRDSLGDPYYLGAQESSPSQGPRYFFLLKKGAPRWRMPDGPPLDPTRAYSVGDLKTLDPKTPSITVKDREFYDDDFDPLRRFTELRFLDLSECVGITDKDLKRLAALKQLKSLTLPGNRITAAGLAHLHSLTTLERLEIGSAEGLGDEAIANLAEMKSLAGLHLNWARGLTDDQLARLAKLSALRDLSIWGSEKITDAGLVQIAKLERLESLTFSHTNLVTPRGVAQLAALKRLKEITLGYMPLNDDILQSLAKIQSLEYIELHGLEITDAGIQALGKLPHLKRIYFDDCRAVTIAGAKKLAARLKGEFVVEE